MTLHHIRRFCFPVIALCVTLLLGGCESIYYPNTVNVSDELLHLRLLGRWTRDGYVHGGSYPAFRDELEFEDDGTFRYTRVWPNLIETQRSIQAGTWSVKDGDLIQQWRKPNGRLYRTSSSQLLETRPRMLVFQNGSGPIESYNRRPRATFP